MKTQVLTYTILETTLVGNVTLRLSVVVNLLLLQHLYSHHPWQPQEKKGVAYLKETGNGTVLSRSQSSNATYEGTC